MKKQKIGGLIVPTFIEPNGKMEKFLQVARDPNVKKEYVRLLQELKTDPMHFSQKLREVVWKGKTLDEIVQG